MYPQAGSSLGGKNACPDGSSDAQVPMTLTCPDMVRYAHGRAYSTTSAAMCCIGGDSNENKVLSLLLQNGWQVVDQKNKVGERADVVAKRLDPKGPVGRVLGSRSLCFKEPLRVEAPLQLLGESSPKPWTWQYPVQDEQRRSFAGVNFRAFSAEQCSRWMNLLLEEGCWIQLPGVPRKVIWYVSEDCADVPYRYSGLEFPATVYPPFMREICKELCTLCGIPEGQYPNSCNVNVYDDGTHEVGWHSDDEVLFQGLACDTRILSLSLGSARDFSWRLQGTSEALGSVPLGDGDVATMEGLFQKHYKHAVPATSQPRGKRINLTFRWIRVKADGVDAGATAHKDLAETESAKTRSRPPFGCAAQRQWQSVIYDPDCLKHLVGPLTSASGLLHFLPRLFHNGMSLPLVGVTSGIDATAIGGGPGLTLSRQELTACSGPCSGALALRRVTTLLQGARRADAQGEHQQAKELYSEAHRVALKNTLSPDCENSDVLPVPWELAQHAFLALTNISRPGRHFAAVGQMARKAVKVRSRSSSSPRKRKSRSRDRDKTKAKRRKKKHRSTSSSDRSCQDSSSVVEVKKEDPALEEARKLQAQKEEKLIEEEVARRYDAELQRVFELRLTSIEHRELVKVKVEEEKTRLEAIMLKEVEETKAQILEEIAHKKQDEEEKEKALAEERKKEEEQKEVEQRKLLEQKAKVDEERLKEERREGGGGDDDVANGDVQLVMACLPAAVVALLEE
eukprot:s635_g27.t2